jgi:hypothetical protein
MSKEDEAWLDLPEFEAELANDDGCAAQSHLDAGRPIYYGTDEYPGIVREYPDGRRELVSISVVGGETLVSMIRGIEPRHVRISDRSR